MHMCVGYRLLPPQKLAHELYTRLDWGSLGLEVARAMEEMACNVAWVSRPGGFAALLDGLDKFP
jgi:hypothetical protein